MSELELEQALAQFDRVGTLVRDGRQRQTWRFEFHGHTYYLYFYPRLSGMRAWLRKASAVGEFFRLQSLQKAGIASPHAVAHLSGFKIGSTLGDALIVDAIPDAVSLDDLLRQERIDGKPIPQKRSLFTQAAQLILQIGRLKLGHRTLGLNSFLVANEKVYFNGAGGLRSGGMKLNDLLHLAQDASRYVSRGDLLRGWSQIEPDQFPPLKNSASPKWWNRLANASLGENDDFGQMQVGEWSGSFVKTSQFGCAWSVASRLSPTARDWESAWPILLEQIQSQQLTVLKRDPSGEVLSGDIVLAGRPISIVVKRPRQKVWWRTVLDRFRTGRATRMWQLAWMLVGRAQPCEWPMILMRRRSGPFVADAMVIFERVPGERLDRVDLNSMTPSQRENLFFRAGRIQRQLEQSGMIHYDSKSTNWIVYHDASRGPTPIMLDPYGVRSLNFFLRAWGIRRLLRAMKQHPQYTPTDSLWLCRGYAPSAHLAQEPSTTIGT